MGKLAGLFSPVHFFFRVQTRDRSSKAASFIAISRRLPTLVPLNKSVTIDNDRFFGRLCFSVPFPRRYETSNVLEYGSNARNLADERLSGGERVINADFCAVTLER
jgi:hypothetical protein